jgi:EmrB/QacA subfamily drug resistance transporter
MNGLALSSESTATAGAPPRGKVQSSNRITGGARWWALGAVLLTMFFSSLDQTVVSTAMPVIIGDLRGLAIYAWVFTAYMMASAITVPIYGKLSDIYGRKPFYLFGLAVFMVGSALSGQSHTMMQLILFRGLQGIGAGAMISMPRATIGDIFTPRERGSWMGVITMTFGLASIIGPFLGGWLTDQWGWRWVFYINLPVAAAALIAIACTLPRVRTEHRASVDVLGSILLVVGILPMLLGFTWAGSTYAWASPQVVALFALSAVGLAAFAWAETRAKEPIIPTRFFRVPIFAITNAISLMLTLGMFGVMLFLPIYVQGVLGMSAQNSGAVITPMMLSFIVGSLVSGQVMTRTGRYKGVAIAGAVLTCAGLLLMTGLTATATWPTVVRDLLVMGLGIGSLMPIMSLSVQNAFPYRDMGVVSATQQFVNSLGGVIAAPILGTVLTNTFTARLKAGMPAGLRLPAAAGNPQNLINAQAQAAIQTQFAGLGPQGPTLYRQFIAALRAALAGGMQHLFLIALFFGIGALLLTLFLPVIRLKREEFFHDREGGQPAAD